MKIRCNDCGKVLYETKLGDCDRYITCSNCRVANLEKLKESRNEILVTDEHHSNSNLPPS